MRLVKLARVRAVFLACAIAFGAVPAAAQQTRDSSFAGLVARLSEPNGYFDSDNIITNEASYLQISSQLRKVGTHGGVYLGVGPDQNFSYVALIRPRIAFMIDIRRDNLLEHLLFKSIFATARNRAEYLCLLLGKPVPADVAQWGAKPAAEILAYVTRTPTDSAAVAATRTASNARITALGVSLDARDRQMIDRYRAEFVASGLDTRYSSLGRNNRFDYPSLGQLIMAADREGHRLSYLADENAYQYVRDMETHDRIVPVVGNVAGDKAVKAIGEYAAEHHLHVSAFYLSNVEQYLLTREGGFPEFARNVATLPHDSTSVIIRSYFGRSGGLHPLYVPSAGNVSTSMIEPIDSFLRRYAAGEIRGYADLVFSGFITP
ncbi:MAG TPA: hypothetical protein VH277_14700 [Gemmatimonadaceae bacterium]|jgi:hypothetical protein|nr:hypothetical protein [Gemmatimonadaceae bacterium]